MTVSRPHLVLWLLATSAAGQLSGSTLLAQAIPLISIPPAETRFAEEFSLVVSVRELADGRVPVTDERDNRIIVLDPARQRSQPVARVGSGPGGYHRVGRLWALAGDSTVMADRQNARWLIFSGSGVVATLPPDSPASRGASGGGRVLSGVARSGDALGRSYPATRVVGGAISEVNHLEAVRFHRVLASADTIRRINESSRFATTVPSVARAGAQPGRTHPRTYSMPIAAQDDAVMFPDGWIAIARTEPYHVEWCAPGSRCMSGPMLSGSPPRMDDSYRRAIMTRMRLFTGWPLTTRIEETIGWPEFVPPFIRPNVQDGSALLAMPDGRLLIHRTPGPGQQAGYDIIDRQGRRVAEIRLPLNQQILGFGPRSVYVVTADEDGLQSISRHPWSGTP